MDDLLRNDPKIKGGDSISFRLLNRAGPHAAIFMEEYPGDNTAKLGDALLCMSILLERSETVSIEDKKEIEAKLTMYDDLLENSSIIKKIRAESEAKGRAEGEIKRARQAIVTIVKGRFPTLVELARKRTSRISKLDTLDSLLLEVGTAPDEETARVLLEPAQRKRSTSKAHRAQNTAGSM